MSFKKESLENALKRNANIYGEILGGSLNADASHITNPTGEGAFRLKILTYSKKTKKLF